jgi:hypothetical protein
MDIGVTLPVNEEEIFLFKLNQRKFLSLAGKKLPLRGANAAQIALLRAKS